MGTNYYLRRPEREPCEYCGRPYDSSPIHLGKSSGGWVYSLRIHPELGLYTLDDIVKMISESGGQIESEYGTLYTLEEWLRLVHSDGYDDVGGLAVVQDDATPRFTLMRNLHPGHPTKQRGYNVCDYDCP